MKLQGLRSAFYDVPSIDEGKAWYRKVFGMEPYFDQPFYVGFNVGGFELGLRPVEGGGPGGGNAYWGVGDADAMVAHLLAHGATAHEPVTEVGEGIRVGSVKDPFGNILGIIYNPHFRYGQPGQ
jgi:predicted enzyme related to lactoylglutathione lyase